MIPMLLFRFFAGWNAWRIVARISSRTPRGNMIRMRSERSTPEAIGGYAAALEVFA
jgi:hypothetical protein